MIEIYNTAYIYPLVIYSEIFILKSPSSEKNIICPKRKIIIKIISENRKLKTRELMLLYIFVFSALIRLSFLADKIRATTADK